MSLDVSNHITFTTECFPPLVQSVIEASGKRVSDTLYHTTYGSAEEFTRIMYGLKIDDPRAYEFILKHSIVIDLGAGYSMPSEIVLDDLPLEYYIGIDFCYRALKVAKEGHTTVIEKPGDFFSVLEGLPDHSVPCFYMRLIDGYILNGEDERLDELLKRKLHPDGKILAHYC